VIIFGCVLRGLQFPGIREHFQKNIKEKYSNIQDVSFESFPEDTVERDPKAYILALDTLKKGDLVTIFTPDDTHYEIAREAVIRGIHVLVTKPSVKKLDHHKDLLELSRKHNSLVAVELHKRWDNAYGDARSQIQGLGDFSYYYSYMSQPKFQLDTFKGWKWGPDASSDISYYLNSHHIDFLVWAIGSKARPIRVIGLASVGVAKSEPYGIDTTDTITLSVQWENIGSKNVGTSVHTASWIAPVSDVHTQQRFHYMGHTGEVMIDQAHRGYSLSVDGSGFRTANPFYMKYTPDAQGRWSGQHGYGFLSIEAFVEAATKVNHGTPASDLDKDGQLATIGNSHLLTAILEAGRVSLDNNNKAVIIKYKDDTDLVPSELTVEH